MESCSITLTKASLDHGNLNIRPCGIGFFPKGVLGGATKKYKGEQISIEAIGLSDIIKTDIPTDDKSKRPRWIFRERAWVKQFIRVNNLKPGDVVTISRIDDKRYKVIPGNGVGIMTSEVVAVEKKHTHKITRLHDQQVTKRIDISHTRTCQCGPTHINCMTAKEWLKSQLGVWEFYYEGRDIRDKTLHPATFPISLAKKIIELFTHQGELVLAPFVGSGTTLIAANELNRNSVGFDLQTSYIGLMGNRK